jgi:hypothetical protein
MPEPLEEAVRRDAGGHRAGAMRGGTAGQGPRLASKKTDLVRHSEELYRCAIALDGDLPWRVVHGSKPRASRRLPLMRRQVSCYAESADGGKKKAGELGLFGRV